MDDDPGDVREKSHSVNVCQEQDGLDESLRKPTLPNCSHWNQPVMLMFRRILQPHCGHLPVATIDLASACRASRLAFSVLVIRIARTPQFGVSF
jgi:hypothetical protein